MASTSRGAQLTEQQRLAQQQVRSQFLVEFLALWALLDSARLDDTGPGWIRAVMPLIRRFRLRSADVATRYYLDFQAAESPSPRVRPRIETPRIEMPPGVERPTPTPAPRRAPRTPEPARTTRTSPGRTSAPPAPSAALPSTPPENTPHSTPSDTPRQARLNIDETAFQRPDRRRTRIEIPDIDWVREDRAAVVSLTVTGPVGQKSKAARGKPLQVARDESFVEASGAASRHVLTGGRKSLLRLAQEDAPVRGWVRVTDGDPCAFCAMLASRGVVFKEGSFSRSDPRFEGPGTVKVHDNCACTIELVYATDTVLPGRAAEFQKMWNDNIRNRYSGKDALNAWRRLYEAQQRAARRSDVA